MKKKLNYVCFAVCIMLSGSVIRAQLVSLKEAELTALHFLAGKSQTLKLPSAPSLTNVRIEKEGNETVCFLFQVSGKGFIVISADKSVTPVLAYGGSGGENLEGLNSSFDFWLEDVKKQIFDVKKDPEKRITDPSTEWDRLLQETAPAQEKSGTPIVGPLTTMEWGQQYAYNDLTPPDGNTCPAGCVAIGMSQAFKYYNHPVKGKNTVLSYYHSTTYGPENTPVSYGLLSADLGNTTYNWANMPDIVNEPNIDVATLIYQAGVAVKMAYSPVSSGAYYNNLENALINAFGYTSNGPVFRSQYTPNGWFNLLKSDLDNDRIILMCGNDYVENVGHCFVVDGYDDENYIHINWGWYGTYNGYFLPSNLSVRDYNWGGGNRIYRIYPTCYSKLSVTTLGATYATVTNTEYAQTNYFQYRAAGTTAWITKSTTNQSVTFTGLMPSTTYQYRDSIVCSELGKVISPIKTFKTYCAPRGNSSYYEWINRISVGTINNTSGNNNGYYNYTQLSSNAVPGTSIPYSFTPGYGSIVSPEQWTAWIDFNKDGDFTDFGEFVINTAPITGTVYGSFSIPANASLGSTRMRITMSYYTATSSCASPAYGEIEDYTIIVTNSQEKTIVEETVEILSDPLFLSCRIYPNPTDGRVNLEISGMKSNATISVKNILGQTVYIDEINHDEEKNTEQMDLTGLSKGMYTVTLLTKETSITRNLIIE